MPIDPLMLQVAERVRARSGGTGIASPDSVLEWAERYRRLEGHKFTLDRFEPLRELYEDEHPRIVVMKPAQRGVSEWAVNLTCFALEYGAKRWVPDGSKNGLNVGYIFPVRGSLNDFSKERISSLKEESTHLAMMFGDQEFDALGFKKIGNSYLYLRGGYSTSDLLSFPADMMIFDEFDRMDSKAIALAVRRMNISRVRRDIRISTPTFPGKGIHAAYLASDQRVYQTQCPGCGEWHAFDFFRDVSCDDQPYDEWKSWSQEQIERSEVTLHCPACNAVIDDAARTAKGRWQAQEPENTRTHGYHIPWWPWDVIDLKMLAYSAQSPDPDEVEEVFRSDLGLPHGVGSGSITEEMLQQLAAELPYGLPDGPWKNTTLGADIGARIHYRVSSEGPDGHLHVRAMGSVPHWSGSVDSLDYLMLRYQARMAVVDAEPEISKATEFCQRWKGRAKRAFYPTNATALKGTLFNVKKDDPTFLQVNRTMAMDDVYGTVSVGAERWPAEIVNDPEVIAHLTAPTRVKTVDPHGQQHFVWVHTTPDHLFHACTYDLIARKLLPKAQSFEPSVGGERTMLTEAQRHLAR